MKIVIAAGGTGGHVYPALTLADAFKQRGDEILFIGSSSRMEKDLIPNHGYKFIGLDVEIFSGSIFNKLKSIFTIFKTEKECEKLIKGYDLAIGFGNYISLPVLLAAKKLGLKTAIHEQNSFAGKANKLLDTKVDLVVGSYKENLNQFKNPNTLILGNPQSSKAYEVKKDLTVLSDLGLNPNMKTVVIFMGSLGSQTVNKVIMDYFKLVDGSYQIVYGTGADGLNEQAVKNIFIAKGRAQDNPLILHVSSIEMIEKIAKNIKPLEYELINNFFPGPLTIILDKKDIVPSVVSANLDTVGIRMPSNKIAHDLIELSNTPIAAPSANISGKPSGTNIDDIFDELNNRVDYIINGGETDIGVESTVIKVIDNKIHILRPGKIEKEDLNKYAEVIIDNHVLGQLKENEQVLSPGMKYKHYAPETKCILIYSDDNTKLINEIQKLEKNNTLVICNNKNIKYFKNAIGYGKTLEEISHNIFKTLRSIDKQNKELVIIEGVKEEKLGLAIMNRLIRACSHNYIKIK